MDNYAPWAGRDAGWLAVIGAWQDQGPGLCEWAISTYIQRGAWVLVLGSRAWVGRRSDGARAVWLCVVGLGPARLLSIKWSGGSRLRSPIPIRSGSGLLEWPPPGQIFPGLASRPCGGLLYGCGPAHMAMCNVSRQLCSNCSNFEQCDGNEVPSCPLSF